MARQQTSRKQPTAERTLHAILRVSGAVRHQAEERMAAFGISPAQWGILRALERRREAGEEPLRMSELGAALLVRPPGLSGAVARMERRQLVAREPDSRDHRGRRITLTTAGQELLKVALVDHARWQRQMLAGLSVSEQRTMANLLNKLTGHLTELGESHGSGIGTPRNGRGKRS